MILITGKSGVGKTTLLKKINFNNIYYMDDIVKKHFYRFYSPVFWKIKKKFGNKTISFFKVKTNILGKIVFEDKKKLKLLNKIVKPYIKKYLNKLKNKNSKIIIEMGAYINNEKDYEKYFDKIILIKKTKPNIDNKFNYLINKKNPIIDKEIKYDFLIKNDDEKECLNELIKILSKL